MSLNKNFLQETTLLNRILASLVLLGFIACNTSDNGNQATEKQITTDTTKKGAKPFSAGTFSYLMLPKEKVVALFAKNGTPSNETKKILLQFVDDNTASNENPIGLIAYGAKTNNTKTTDAIPLDPILDSLPKNLSGLKYLGNLELTRKQLNQIFGNTNNPPLGTNNSDTLYLVPVMSQTYPNYVSYRINVKTNKKIVADIILNPSPPADPCTPPCDQNQ